MANQAGRALSEETTKLIGEEVMVKGWVHTRRDHGKLIFLDVIDRSAVLQVVVNPKNSQEAYKTAAELKPQYAVEVKGIVKKRPEGTINKDEKTGEVELEAKEINILAKAESLPFDIESENLELPTLLDNRSLTLRSLKAEKIFKVQEAVVKSFRDTLSAEGFTEIFVPTIVKSATEGGAEVFKVDYYDHDAYLAQSPQLYKQIMVGVFERVFTISHAYRAEPSTTTRHLSEYISMDAEMGFINSWEDLMDISEIVITNILSDVGKLDVGDVPQIKTKIPRLKLSQAQEMVFKKTGKDHRNAPDLDPADEKELCNWAKQESGAPFVFVTHYPVSKRPFYTMPDPDDSKNTLSFDLLGFNEEWVTGGQRINDYQALLTRIKEKGNNASDFEIYLQAFKYGMPPEGGFAMGG